MTMTGYITALRHVFETPIQYHLQLGSEQLSLNPLIGQKMRIRFLNDIACIHCGRKIKKTYNQGSCYPCFQSLAENDLCIVKPELCHHHQGTCRDNQFAEAHCMQPHIIYLAISSGVKVGITRKPNAIKRWIDQGAAYALPILEVPTRKISGEIESTFAQHIADKTNWRKMLKGEIVQQDLHEVRDMLFSQYPAYAQQYAIENPPHYEFTYPQVANPEKLVSFQLAKTAEIEGTLIGVKAQYLLFDTGVMQVRKHAGHRIAIEV